MSTEREKVVLELSTAGDRHVKEGLSQVVGSLKTTRLAAKETGTSMQDLGSTFGKFKSIAAGFGIGIGIGTLTSFASHVVDAADQVGDLATKMGVSVEAAQRFQYAARQSGAGIEDVSRALVAMNNNLAKGDQSTVTALAQAGLSFDAIRGLKPEDAFRSIADAIGTMPDPMNQTRVAMELFGKAGAELLPMIREQSLLAADGINVMSQETVTRLKDAQQWWQNLWDTIVIGSAETLAKIGPGDGSLRDRFQGYAGDSGNMRVSDEEVRQINLESLTTALKNVAGVYKDIPPKVKSADEAMKAFDRQSGDSVKQAEQLADKLIALEKQYQAYKETLLTGVTPALRQQMDWDDRIARETGLSIDQIRLKVTSFEHLIKTMQWYGRELLAMPDNPLPRDVFTGGLRPFGDGAAFGLRPDARGFGPIPPDITQLTRYIHLLGLAQTGMRELGQLAKGNWKLVTSGVQGAIDILSTYQVAMRAAQTAAEISAAASAAAWAVATLGISLAIQGVILLVQHYRRQRQEIEGLTQQLADMGYTADEALAIAGSGVGSLTDRLTEALHQAQILANETTDAIGGMGAALDYFGGHAPAALRPYILALLDSTRLSAEQREMLRGLATEPSWKELEQNAKELGISVDALGGAFQQLKVNDLAKRYFAQYTQFTDIGADQNAVLTGMADEIQALIGTGASLPEFLRPMIDQMIGLGLLMDRSGNTLTDSLALQFNNLRSPQEEAVDWLHRIYDLLAIQMKDLGPLPPVRDDAHILGVPGLPYSGGSQHLQSMSNWLDAAMPEIGPSSSWAPSTVTPSQVGQGEVVANLYLDGRLLARSVTPRIAGVATTLRLRGHY